MGYYLSDDGHCHWIFSLSYKINLAGWTDRGGDLSGLHAGFKCPECCGFEPHVEYFV